MVRTLRFTAEGTISMLVGELGSHKLRGVAKKKPKKTKTNKQKKPERERVRNTKN